MHKPSQAIEVRGFKWPRRATSVTVAQFLGEDTFGRWLGVPKGTPWRFADKAARNNNLTITTALA